MPDKKRNRNNEEMKAKFFEKIGNDFSRVEKLQGKCSFNEICQPIFPLKEVFRVEIFFFSILISNFETFQKRSLRNFLRKFSTILYILSIFFRCFSI